MKSKFPRNKSHFVASVVASMGVVTSALLMPSAASADILGTYTSDVSTVEQGGTVTFTLSRSYYGFNTTDGDILYFCNEMQAGDTSDDELPGWSIVLMLMDQNNNVITMPNTLVSGTSANDYLFDGPGVGDFIPNEYPYTGQLVFPFTIPSTVPAGNYGAVLGCISPAYRSVTIDPTYWNSPIIPLSVTASNADTAAGELPKTGSSQESTGAATLAVLFVMTLGGLALAYRHKVGTGSSR